MQNRGNAKVMLKYCVEERKYIQNISQDGEDNWSKLDEQIHLLTSYLKWGAIPNMDRYREQSTSVFALWLLQKNTEFDDLVKELIENDN